MQWGKGFDELYQPFDSSIEHNGAHYLYFGGTAYLGISKNEEFLRLYMEGVKLFGLNNGSSRNNNVQQGIYLDAEKTASKRFGSESALITSSGYLAAQMIVKRWANFGQVIYAPGTHSALWIDQKPDTNVSFTDWKSETVEIINSSTVNKWVVISNAMNNLRPEIFDFGFIKGIDPQKELVLIIDDSHGIGINNKGKGAFSAIPKCNNVETIVVASMAKALGVDAGIILGSEKMIQILKETTVFLGASPPSAAGLYAFMKAEKVYIDELRKLKNNMLLCSQRLRGKDDWHFVEDFPVYLSKNAELSERLLKQHILISSFAYPEKDGPKINRVVLSSWHTNAEIERLITAL